MRDRPRDLSFERAPVVDLLEELGGAERGAVEDLEADAARRRQALAGELEPQLVDLVGRHPDRPAARRRAGTAIFCAFSRVDDLGGRLGVHVGEQQRVRRRDESQYAEPTTRPTTTTNTPPIVDHLADGVRLEPPAP